jgi:hypothetical protein
VVESSNGLCRTAKVQKPTFQGGGVDQYVFFLDVSVADPSALQLYGCFGYLTKNDGSLRFAETDPAGNQFKQIDAAFCAIRQVKNYKLATRHLHVTH